MSNHAKCLLACILSLTILMCALTCSAEGTAFTYQGKLTENGQPATGTQTVDFKLFDAVTQGGQIGSTVTAAVQPENGLFTVKLDFGIDPFRQGARRWIEIAVGGRTLSPRVELTPTPYALTAMNVMDGSVTWGKLAATLQQSFSAPPPGSMILTASQTPPAGYTYTGDTVVTEYSNCWKSRSKPTSLMYDTFAVAALGDKIYAFTDAVPMEEGQSNTYEYNPQLDAWTAKAIRQSENTWGTLAAAALGGFLYLVDMNGKLFRYDPAADTWGDCAPCPVPPGIYPQWTPIGAGGKLYVMASGDWSAVNLMYEYTPATNSWVQKTPMPTARSNFAVAAFGEKVYAIGGSVPDPMAMSSPTGRVEVYDPQTDTWAPKASMPTARQGLTAFTLADRIYAAGGTYDSMSMGYLSMLEEYDPAMNRWIGKAPLLYSSSNGATGTRVQAAASGDAAYVFLSGRPVQEYTPSKRLYIHAKN